MLSIFKMTTYLVAIMILVTGVIAANVALAQGNAVPVDRLIIRFQQNGLPNGDFEVIGHEQLTKVLPPSDSLPAEGVPVSGFYYELQSAGGTVLYRRIIRNPIPLVVEVPQKLPDTTADLQPPVRLERKQIIPRQRIFTILIPRAGVGDQLVLFSSPFQSSQQDAYMRSNGQTGAAREISRISLDPSTLK